MSKISVGSRVMVALDSGIVLNLEKEAAGTVLDVRRMRGGIFDCDGMFEYLVDVDGYGLGWYDWFQVEAVGVNTSEQKELEIKTQQTYTAGELKKLLNKMDDSIKFTFSGLKIHFG